MVDVTIAEVTPKLASKARLKYDKVRSQHLLLLPEKVVVLNETAAEILAHCDGTQSVHTIAQQLRARRQEEGQTEEGRRPSMPDLAIMEADIVDFIRDIIDKSWVVADDG